MGITGLIPFLENASTPINIRTIQGSSVAVDSYCWLHKGVFACAEKLARGEKTNLFVNYCVKYIEMLTSNRIKVIMVFDGRHLPAKAETERKRREARKESKKLAKEFLRMNEIEKARSHMRRAIDVTHEMALELIKVCRERGVDCIVAPYEADAQMAWLNKVGLADYVITEDSDLTLFGAERILFKLDLNGSALLVEKEKLSLAMGCKPEKYTFDKFRRMCILSGCDYLESLPGIGLKKACKFILLTEEDDMRKALKKLPSYLKMKQLDVSTEYIEKFLKAEATFRHMFVYNPLKRRMERLCDLKDFQTEEAYCVNAGSLMEDSELAFQLALGNIDPFTLKQLDDWSPDKKTFSNIANKNKNPQKSKSIWNGQEQFKSECGQQDGPMPTIFKKIEFRNMTEMEIKENQRHERFKLEESEVFSIYNAPITSVYTKRKRSCSDEEQETMVEQEQDTKTPSKSVNPFAKSFSFEKDPRSPICANKSLLKTLSPRKDFPKIDVKSHFFSQSIKQAVKKPFAARDLTGEMTKIEEKTTKFFEIQRTLQIDLSQPQSDKESDYNNKNRKGELEQQADKTSQTLSPSQKAIEDAISLSEDEEECADKKSNLSSSQSSAISKSSDQRRIKSSKPRDSRTLMKKAAPIDSKQSTLSMFGFQKRPTLKKN